MAGDPPSDSPQSLPETDAQASGGAPTGAPIDPADIAACLRVLGRLADDPSVGDELADVGRAVAKAYKRVGKDRRWRAERQAARAAKDADRATYEATLRCRQEPRPAELLSAGLALPSPTLPPKPEAAGETPSVTGSELVAELIRPRTCYVCKNPYRQLHPFYHQLCPACGAENFARRSARADLAGRRALITGGRIKIGYHAALMLLRDGAEVIVTSRFPRDAADRYAAEPDFATWRNRLRIYGLDLRDLPATYAFADHLVATCDELNILINNAAQTVRREAPFYQSMYERERGVGLRLTTSAQALLAAPDEAAEDAASSAVTLWHWPDDLPYDAAGRPRDARPTNSWTLELPDVEPTEMAEVMLVNAMSPFALCSRLEPLLRKSRFPDRYVVNVSAMEGRFNRGTKTSRHPHTNMAKAALNMLTRTAAARLAEVGIFMNSVDTGWITEENPHPTRARVRVDGFVPPLDDIDGAARVYDPVVRGVRDRERLVGLFLKDYRPVSW